MSDNEQEPKPVKIADASGRGSVEDFNISFPARMRPYKEAEIDAVVDVMRNAEAQTQGEYLRQFQADFEQYTGAQHAFAVDNCTNALRLAALICQLQPGDEVIISGYTFCATAIPYGETGAQIVWADIDPDTWVADPADIERKITHRTRAIVVVHLLGLPVDMPAVVVVNEKTGTVIIGQNVTIRRRFLAALLRIADECDITHNRTPETQGEKNQT